MWSLEISCTLTKNNIFILFIILVYETFNAQPNYIYIYIAFFKIKNYINLLKTSPYVMHQQFNIQQLHALPTLYLCVLYLSENKQRLVTLTT